MHLLYSLVRYRKPTLIVEAGTYRGHATCAMALACKQNGVGNVYSADIEDYRAADAIEANGLAEYVTLFHGDYGAMLEQFNMRSIELAFIDSGPTVAPAGETSPSVMSNIRFLHAEATGSRLAVGGMMVIDDMRTNEWYGAKELRETAGLYLNAGRGIAIVQRR